MDFVAQIVKYNAQTNGRDKLCRFVQYASKYANWYVTKANHKELMTKMKTLETSLSSTRKVLRFGKSLDCLQGAMKCISVPDPLVRICLVIAKLNQACYLFLDHYVWLAKTGLVQGDAKKISKTAAKFWLITIGCNLIRNIYDILGVIDYLIRYRGRARAKKSDDYQNESLTASQNAAMSENLIIKGITEHKPVFIDTLKNASDLILPLSSLGFIQSSDALLGIMGMIGSLMGIIVVWYPKNKLSPS